jgi:uncharacterized protein
MKALGAIVTSALLALLWSAAPAVAHALDVPQLSGRVNDYAHVLTAERAQALEAKLAAYERSSGHQLVLLTLDSLKGDAIEPFAIRVYDEWKLGVENRDDSVLLIVVPQERKVRIEVGYGLEGVIPDAIAARVIREVIAPAFRQEDYGGGIDAAFDALIRAAGGEDLPAAPSTAQPRRRSPLGLLPTLFVLFVLFLIMGGGGGGGRRRWLGPLLGAGMNSFGGGGYRGGGFSGGGFGGGGGGFGGGGGGGGFSGGGGGSGGGGASGGW